MPDNKSKRGKADRARVAAKQPYEVAHLAKSEGVSKKKAEALIKQYGPSRKAIKRRGK